MSTSMNLDNSNVVALIQENIALFEQFDTVYLFGSVLEGNGFYNDVDLLLIYSKCPDKISKKINNILIFLEELLNVSVDLTVLSLEEEREIQFLNWISPRCYRLK